MAQMFDVAAFADARDALAAALRCEAKAIAPETSAEEARAWWRLARRYRFRAAEIVRRAKQILMPSWATDDGPRAA